MDIDFEDRELRELFVDLGKVPGRVVPAVIAVVNRGALNIKRDWAANATESAGLHGPHYPRSIDYDMHIGIGTIAAEIGPNPTKPQGGMSFEYGSRNQPPHLDGAKATDAEEPKFLAALAKAVEQAVQKS